MPLKPSRIFTRKVSPWAGFRASFQTFVARVALLAFLPNALQPAGTGAPIVPEYVLELRPTVGGDLVLDLSRPSRNRYDTQRPPSQASLLSPLLLLHEQIIQNPFIRI
jgi:hypothetical protein